MTATEIEARLSKIEEELAQLKAQRTTTSKLHPIHTLEAISGIFEDNEAFREAMRLGRKWRESQRPKARKARAKAKRK